MKRRFLRVLSSTLNRVTAKLARSGHGPFSMIRHVGRHSGRSYATPVILARVPEGFVAELTFGEEVNWYLNVVAAGSCTVLYRGEEYRVEAIEPCDAAAGRSAYPSPFKDILRLLRRKDFRLLLVPGPGR